MIFVAFLSVSARDQDYNDEGWRNFWSDVKIDKWKQWQKSSYKQFAQIDYSKVKFKNIETNITNRQKQMFEPVLDSLSRNNNKRYDLSQTNSPAHKRHKA